MRREILLMVEEALNCRGTSRGEGAVDCAGKFNAQLLDAIDAHLGRPEEIGESTIYEDAVSYLRRLGNPRFLRKSGGVKEAAFYQYACIDKSTWSELKWNQVKPSKKTVFKLILALELTQEEAEALLGKVQAAFDPAEMQDQVILAMVNLREQGYELSVDDAAQVLDYYRENGPRPFNSIYDTPEILAERKKQAKG